MGLAFIVKDHLLTPFDAFFESVGKARGVDPNLLRAIGRKESRFNAGAIGDQGRSIGLMQVQVQIGARYGYTRDDLLDPRKNIDAAARLLVDLKRELGDQYTLDTLIAAYNAGSPAILARGIFNESYVAEVKQNFYLYSAGRALA